MRADAVGQAAQAGPGGRVRAADAVVADLDLEPVASRRTATTATRRGVLGDVGQRLGDHEVGGRLDRHRQPLVELGVELDRDRDAAASVSSAATRPRSVSTAGWMPRARSRRSSIAVWRVLERVVDEPRARSGLLLPALLGELKVDHDVHELLLGAVVEVAAEPAALLVAGLQDAGARGGQLLARVGVGQRVGDQLRRSR